MPQARDHAHVGVPAVLGLAALVFCALALVQAIETMPLTRHMATHILLMGGLAPGLAFVAARELPRQVARPVMPLAAAVTLQAAGLFAFHLPTAQDWAMRVAWGGPVVHAALLGLAVVFWQSVFASIGSRRWHAVAALLISGKLFCLLGILLVFARRPLFPAMIDPSLLTDQQLAGLLMLAACPATYIFAAFVVTYRGIPGLGQQAHDEFAAQRVERAAGSVIQSGQ